MPLFYSESRRILWCKGVKSGNGRGVWVSSAFLWRNLAAELCAKILQLAKAYGG